MLIKSQFNIDQIQLKYNPDPEGLVRSHMLKAATELGHEIVKHFPFKKDEENSFKGEAPSMSMNRDHQYVDRYETRFVILSEEKIYEAIKVLDNLHSYDLEGDPSALDKVIKIINLLTT